MWTKETLEEMTEYWTLAWEDLESTLANENLIPEDWTVR